MHEEDPASAPPALSVVIASVSGYGYIAQCLRSLPGSAGANGPKSLWWRHRETTRHSASAPSIPTFRDRALEPAAEYGRFMLPLEPRPEIDLPGPNVAYRRHLLDRPAVLCSIRACGRGLFTPAWLREEWTSG